MISCRSENIELRLGRWQDVLTDVGECDAVVTDPPYSERTHTGQRTGSSTKHSTISYAAMNDHSAVAEYWSIVAKHWALIFCDHSGFIDHARAWGVIGWNTFAPVLWVKPNPAPRMCGDGPTCSHEDIMVARPRAKLRDPGSRPGHYIVNVSPDQQIPGAKPLALMRALIRDYTRSGDLVIDPYSGSGTTLLAAAIEGRSALGAECDPTTYELAVRRLKRGYTPGLFV